MCQRAKKRPCLMQLFNRSLRRNDISCDYRRRTLAVRTVLSASTWKQRVAAARQNGSAQGKIHSEDPVHPRRNRRAATGVCQSCSRTGVGAGRRSAVASRAAASREHNGLPLLPCPPFNAEQHPIHLSPRKGRLSYLPAAARPPVWKKDGA